MKRFKLFMEETKYVSINDPTIKKLIGEPKRSSECESYEKGKNLSIKRYGAWIHPKKDWIIPVAPFGHQSAASEYLEVTGSPLLDTIMPTSYEGMFLLRWVRQELRASTEYPGKYILFLKGFSKDIEAVVFPLVERLTGILSEVRIEKLKAQPTLKILNNTRKVAYHAYLDDYSGETTFYIPADLVKLFSFKF